MMSLTTAIAIARELAQTLSDDRQRAAIAKVLHELEAHVGLWATDRPEMIPDDIKHLFFEVTP